MNQYTVRDGHGFDYPYNYTHERPTSHHGRVRWPDVDIHGFTTRLSGPATMSPPFAMFDPPTFVPPTFDY